MSWRSNFGRPAISVSTSPPVGVAVSMPRFRMRRRTSRSRRSSARSRTSAVVRPRRLTSVTIKALPLASDATTEVRWGAITDAGRLLDHHLGGAGLPEGIDLALFDLVLGRHPGVPNDSRQFSLR